MRTVTGVLSSRLTSRDIKIDGFSMYVRRAFSLPRISTRLGSPPRMHIMGEEGWAATTRRKPVHACAPRLAALRALGRRLAEGEHRTNTSHVAGRTLTV